MNEDTFFNAKVERLHRLQDEVFFDAYEPGPDVKPGEDYSREWAAQTHVPMGLTFMVDMLPFIMRCIRNLPGRPLSIIDVGCGLGSGAELLGNMMLGEKREILVHACDELSVYTRFCKAFHRHVQYVNLPLSELNDNAYDLAVCSNVLEHYEDPMPQIEKLRSVAREFVVILVPFNEPLGNYDHHHFSFTQEYIEALNPLEACYETPINKQACFVLNAKQS